MLFRSERIGQGKDNARQFLKDHPEIGAEIEKRIRSALGLPVRGGAGKDEAATHAAKDGGNADTTGDGGSDSSSGEARTAGRSKGGKRKSSAESTGA